jgi:hypothetical protein
MLLDKQYWSLKELQEDLLGEKVDGILVDTYVADSRRDLFGDSRLLLKQIIDLKSSYGVVMGKDATKLRKCFNQFWSENKATKIAYIQSQSDPLVVSVRGIYYFCSCINVKTFINHSLPGYDDLETKQN